MRHKQVASDRQMWSHRCAIVNGVRSIMEPASGGEPSDVEGQPARVSERERANQLPADKNKNAGDERQNTCDHKRDCDCVKERSDADQNKIDREQQHSDVLSDVHTVVCGAAA